MHHDRRTVPQRNPGWHRTGGTLALVLLAVAALSPPIASAAPSAPDWTTSYYLDTHNTTTLYNLGHALGVDVHNGDKPLSPLVLFNWGGQDATPSGAWRTIGIRFANVHTTNQIKAAIQEFGHGFYVGTGSTGSAFVTMAVGTNNDLTVGSGAGTEWGNMVDDINVWLSTHGPVAARYADQAMAIGANDIESGFCLNDPCPNNARRWADFYASHSGQPYYNDGGCAGCAPAGSGPNGDWVYDDIYYVSWGASNAWPLPEIYREDGIQAAQWERMKEWGHNHTGQNMFFVGALTQYNACGQTGGCSTTRNHPWQGWAQLWNALNAQADYDNHTAPSYAHQSVTWSTDLFYDPY